MVAQQNLKSPGRLESGNSICVGGEPRAAFGGAYGMVVIMLILVVMAGMMTMHMVESVPIINSRLFPAMHLRHTL